MTKTFKKALQATGAAAVLALALAAPAGAVTVDAGLTPGVLNTIEDQDREAYIDNGDGVLGVGDVFIGFVRLDNFLPSGVDPDGTVYGVISNQIISVSGDGTIFNLGTTTMPGLTLPELTGDAETAGGMFAIYDGIASADLIANAPGGDIFSYIDYITTGDLALVTGLVSGDNYLMVDNNVGFPAGTPNGSFSTLPTSVTTGSFTGGLDVVFNGTTFDFADAVVTVDALGGLHTTQVGIGNGSVRGAFGDGNEAAFTNAPGFLQCTTGPCGFVTDADFFVFPTAVPEPGSLALLGGALLGALGLRRRKQV
jgi:hypothetical protein